MLVMERRQWNRAVCFILIGAVIFWLYSLSVVNDKASYTRFMIKEMYKEEQIDVLFLGASHVYRGIDPEYIDQSLGVRSYNAGSSNQRPEDSYYLLKEILNETEVKTIVYDINYVMFQQHLNDPTIRTHILLDYFKPSMNKVLYAEDVLKNPIYSNTVVSNVIRYKEGWKMPRQMLVNLSMHLTDNRYKTLDYSYAERETEKYAGRGFVYSYPIMDSELADSVPWEEETISWRQVEYLDRIVSLCEERGVALQFISIPVYENYLRQEPRYQEIYEFFQKKADEAGITYVDFNLDENCTVKTEKQYYQDASHLNGKGAGEFSRYLCKKYMENRKEKLEKKQ